MRWQRTLWIMFFAQICTSMGFSIIFPFLPLFVEELGTNTSLPLSFWAGMVFSGQAIAMTITAPIWGAVADRYGRKLMVERATFGGAVVVVLMAYATSAEQLTLLRVIQGLVTGVVAAANALVAAETPRERMGYSMGVLQLALWAGVAIGPLIGGILADAYGFRVPHLLTGGLLFIAWVMVRLGVKESFSPEQRQANKQQGMMSEWRHILTMRGVIPTYSIRFMSGMCRSMLIPVLPLYVAMLLAEAVTEFSLVPAPFLHASAALIGVSTITGLVVGSESAASTVSGIYFGRLGDKIGHRRVIMICGAIGCLFFLPQAFVADVWQLLALTFLGGFAVGGIVSAPSALLARYTQPGEEGAVFGIDNSVVAAARAIAPLLGTGIAAFYGLRAPFILAAVLFGFMVLWSAYILPHEDTDNEANMRHPKIMPQAQPSAK
jgi:DHA1 family multidrug resistance protein-like MFS transporter